MSRRIDTSKQLSADDVQYLQDRARTAELKYLGDQGKLPEGSAEMLEVRQKLAEEMPAGPSAGLAGPPPPGDDPEADWLQAWTKAQLREELAKSKYTNTDPTVLSSDDKATLMDALYTALDELESEEDPGAGEGEKAPASKSSKSKSSTAASVAKSSK